MRLNMSFPNLILGKEEQMSVNNLQRPQFGFSVLIRFHLQRLRFPNRGSLAVDNQNLIDMHVILGK